MDAGYFLSNLAFLLSALSPLNGAIYLLTWVCLGYRIREEERHLMQDPAYSQYASQVRYRLIPGVI